MPALLVAFAVVAGIQPGLALAQEDELDALFACSEADPINRFDLCNVCRPLLLLVKDLSEDATDIGLTEERLRITAESRLRAARLYTDSREESNRAVLSIVFSTFPSPLPSQQAVIAEVKYLKRLFDPVTAEITIKTTWRMRLQRSYGAEPGDIIQAVSEAVDKFLVEYLRVNEEHCPR